MGSHKRRRKRSTSSDSSSESSSDDSHKRKKVAKGKRRVKKRREVTSSSSTSSSSSSDSETANKSKSTDIPIELMAKSKKMAPMTKEEWEKQQSVVKRVYDEASGRHRLIKGDGEVIEEIVSRDRHKAINKQATKADGDYFQTSLKK